MAEAAEEQLVKRIRELEESQEKLRQQLLAIAQGGNNTTQVEEEEERERERRRQSYRFPGFFAGGTRYQRVLQQLGHAVHVHRPTNGEIICWNKAAENLFGWKDYEVLGQKSDLLMDAETQSLIQEIKETIYRNRSWSGQLPFRKKSGETFMAMVTESLLYEDGKVVGIITVSSDAAMFLGINSDKMEMLEGLHDRAKQHDKIFKRLQWQKQPQIATSVSTLVSKVLNRNHASSDSEDESPKEMHDWKGQNHNEQPSKDGLSASVPIFRLPEKIRNIERTYKGDDIISKLNQQSKVAAKVLAKFQIRGCTDCDQVLGKDDQAHSGR